MLKLEHVKKTFNKGSANEVVLYKDLNVEIHDGEFVTIIGSNGSGKSTFFNVISGNIRQDAGEQELPAFSFAQKYFKILTI